MTHDCESRRGPWGRRRLGWLALAIASVSLAAACGARTAPYLGGGVSAGGSGNQSATGGTDTTLAGGDTTGGGGGTGTGTGTNTGGSSSANSNKSTPGTSPNAVAPPSSFNYSAAAEAAACTGTAGNTASDVGITPTSINVGNVSGLTGVITNSFEQGPQAVQALFSAINAQGGICGRKLNLTVEDDGQDAGRNQADIADLANKVLAFVGSTSDADSAGVQTMVNAKVPDVGFAINANRGQSSVFWSAGGSTLYTQGNRPYGWNTLQNGLKSQNQLPKKLAVIAYSIPISADAAKQFAYQFQQAGSQICFEDYGVSPATASLDQDVLSMKQKGCDGVFATMDSSGNAKLMQSEQRQNYHPPYTAVTFAGYAQSQIDVAHEDAAQGLQVTLPFLPFNEPNPVMQLYLSQLTTYQPGKEPSSFGIQAWAAAQMFVYALIKAGRNPTRASLVNVFSSLTDYDTGGIMAPVTPRLRQPNGKCVMQVEVKGHDFVRKWPASGLYCNSQLVPSGP